MFGSEASLDASLSWPRRIYICLFGAPEIGAKIRWNILKKVIAEMKYDSCFDAGCGTASMIFHLAKNNPRRKYTGFDLDTGKIMRNREISQRLSLTNIDFIQGNLLDLPIGEKFDLILSVDNLEHIEDDIGALRQIMRIMTPDSVLIVHVPRKIKKFVFRSSYNNVVHDHVRDGYEPGELIDKLEQTGFRAVSSTGGYNLFQTLANELGTWASRFLPIYAFFLPFLTLISLFPEPLADLIRPVRNSVIVTARLK